MELTNAKWRIEGNILIVVWQDTLFAENTFAGDLRQIADYISINNLKLIMSDARKSRNLTVSDQQVQHVYLIRYSELTDKIAIILPDSFFGQSIIYELEQAFDKIKVFRTQKEAKEWLKA
jgi:uncharacterized protein YihD (DUF1040 family)